MKKLGADWLSRGATGSLMNTKQLTFRFHERWSIFYAEQGRTLPNEVRFRQSPTYFGRIPSILHHSTIKVEGDNVWNIIIWQFFHNI
jgi:hypothetical protein